jgi:ABC-type branched-subunit amino acid transport system substrate-binding protein
VPLDLKNNGPGRRDTPKVPIPAAPLPPPQRGSTPPPGRTGDASSRSLVIAGAAVGLIVLSAVVAGVVRAVRSGGAPRPEAAAVPAPEPAAVPQASSPSAGVNGVSDSEIVFGMSSPFSGAIKELGRAMRTGVETAFAAANEAGGVHGRKLSLVALDDGYEPARTRETMKELVEQRKVFAIVGNVGTPTAAVSIPYVQEKKVIFFGPLSGGPGLRKTPPDRYVFNYRPSYAEETAAAVRYLVEVRRVPPHQIAVFMQDDEFGQAGLAGVEQQVRRYRRDPAQIFKLTYRRNSADVATAVARLRQNVSRVKAVVMVATYQAAIQFVQRVRDLRAPIVLTNVSAVDSNALAEGLTGAGTRYATDVVVTQIVPLPSSKATAVLRYQKALEKSALGEHPGFLSLEGWIVGNLLVEGLKRAGRNLDTETLVAALEGIQGLDLGIGTTISFGPSEHQGSHKVWGTMLQPDGTYKAIDLE